MSDTIEYLKCPNCMSTDTQGVAVETSGMVRQAIHLVVRQRAWACSCNQCGASWEAPRPR